MFEYTCTILGDPAPLAHCKYNNKRIYDTQSHAKNAFIIQLDNVITMPPLSVAFSMYIDFFMAMPRSTPVFHSRMRGKFHAYEPNLIDLERFILEACNHKLYKSMNLVGELISRKIYDDIPRVTIKVRV